MGKAVFNCYGIQNFSVIRRNVLKHAKGFHYFYLIIMMNCDCLGGERCFQLYPSIKANIELGINVATPYLQTLVDMCYPTIVGFLVAL